MVGAPAPSSDRVPAWLRRVRPRTRLRALGRAGRRGISAVGTVPSRLAAQKGRIRWRRALNRALRSPLPTVRRVGVAPDDALVVVMCLWSRPGRLRTSIEQLAGQLDAPPLRLILWNNQPANDAHCERVIEELGATGAVAGIDYCSSRVNLGGIARFVVARHLTDGKPGVPFVMVDDDQDVSSHFIADLLAVFRPRTYAGFWAFTAKSSYWDREEAAGGAPVNYVGTGGSVCDAEIVRDRGFFDRLPARYGFIEDLWASYFASSRGWRLTKVDTPITLQDEQGNQYHRLRELKDEFLQYLRSRTAGGQVL